MIEIYERIIRDLYRALCEVEQVPYPIEDYLTDADTKHVAISIIGDGNHLPPCVECNAPADHYHEDGELFCVDCCPDCNEEEP